MDWFLEIFPKSGQEANLCARPSLILHQHWFHVNIVHGIMWHQAQNEQKNTKNMRRYLWRRSMKTGFSCIICVVWAATSCQLSGSSPVTELLLSLWSSSCSDLPYRSLVALDWWEAVYSVHCQWHDMWICPGLQKRHSLIKLQALFVFQWPWPKSPFGNVYNAHYWVLKTTVCGDVIRFVYVHISNTTNHLKLLFLTPATKIMWCLSTNLFTGSKVVFFFLFKW